MRNTFFQYQHWALEIDEGRIPAGIQELMEEMGVLKQEKTEEN